ncbi:MAG: Hsp20/alpha crystallin family protein [Patescibacteria group bacterium]
MSIVRWSPMWDPFEEMEAMMNRLPVMSGAPKGFVPAMDVYETKDVVMVETPLAGVNPNDVKITVENGVLTVQGESKKEHELDEKNYYRKEVRSGSFFRQVALPASVKEGAVSAEFTDGMLKITCPKSAPPEAKKIEVKVTKK